MDAIRYHNFMQALEQEEIAKTFVQNMLREHANGTPEEVARIARLNKDSATRLARQMLPMFILETMPIPPLAH